MKIKYSHGIVTGSTHLKLGMPCLNKIEIIDENGIAAMVLTDGDDNKESSELCTGIVAKAAAVLLKNRFDDLFATEEDVTKRTMIQSIMQELGKTDLALISMASTLTFVAVKDSRYLAAHIGHGGIIGLAESCTVLSGPQKGLYGNKTNYITDLNASDNLQIDKGYLQEPFGYMLISDGACQSLCDNGTGSPSPVCGTLFGWLREHDGETVGEALVDNINKYFTENTEADITIAMMVSAEDEQIEEGPAAATEEAIQGEDKREQKDQEEASTEDAAEDASKTSDLQNDSIKKAEGKSKLRSYGIFALIAVAVIIGIIFFFQSANDGNNDKNIKADANAEVTTETGIQAEDPEEESYTIEDYYPNVTYSVEDFESFPAGQYEVGIDIPAGEYFFCTGEMLQPDTIEINEESCLSGQLFCMNIQVEEGDTLLSQYSFVSSDLVNPIQPVKGVLISGKYKIGKDLAPGQYTIASIDKALEGRCYFILDGEIGDDVVYEDSDTITVPEEGYAVAYNSMIIIEKID